MAREKQSVWADFYDGRWYNTNSRPQVIIDSQGAEQASWNPAIAVGRELHIRIPLEQAWALVLSLVAGSPDTEDAWLALDRIIDRDYTKHSVPGQPSYAAGLLLSKLEALRQHVQHNVDHPSPRD